MPSFRSGPVARAVDTDIRCRCAAQSNVDISSAPAANAAVWDGLTLTAGAYVMLPRQTDANENRPWRWNGAGLAMTAHPKLSNASQFYDGVEVKVARGTADKDTTWRLKTDLPVGGYVLGTTDLEWDRDASVAAGGGGGWEHYQTFALVEDQTDYLFSGATWPAGAQADTTAWKTLVQWGPLLLVPTTDYTIAADRVSLTSAPDAEEVAGGQPLVVRVARAM